MFRFRNCPIDDIMIPIEMPSVTSGVMNVNTAATSATNINNSVGKNKKITRVRTGCWTCKKRRRKCDEAKPHCNNCLEKGKACEGYGVKLSFDVDDSRHSSSKTNKKGETLYGFRGRPRLNESLSKRENDEEKKDKKKHNQVVFISDGLSNSSQLRESHVPRTHPTPSHIQLPPIQSPSSLPLQFQYNTNKVLLQPIINVSEQPMIRNPPIHSIKFASYSNTDTPISTTISPLNESLSSHSSQKITTLLKDFTSFEDMFPSIISSSHEAVPSFIANLQKDRNYLKLTTEQQTSANFNMSAAYNGNSEENLILKHFFNTLLPLTDAHPSTPWPQLILKYCDFEVAKSCFISLACIHLYETKGAKEFYKTGMEHITATMEYLINYLKELGDDADEDKSLDVESESRPLDVVKLLDHLKETRSTEENRTNFMVILILIHVHLLFSVLESGRSALARTFFELSTAIVNDKEFKQYLTDIDGSSTLVGNIAWFEIISAMVSPDCRLPYSDDIWLGSKDSVFSTSKLMGCPPEIFKIMKRFCSLRKEFKDKNYVMDEDITSRFEVIKHQLLDYREYVDYEDKNFSYAERLKCTQCWTLALLLNLYQLVKPKETALINEFINEFINVYSSLSSLSPIISQMVWPVFTISCSANEREQRLSCEKYLVELYQNTKSGTVSTVIQLTKQCWVTGVKVDDILAGKEWFESGIDFLVI